MIFSIHHLHVIDTSGVIAVTNTANGVYILCVVTSRPETGDNKSNNHTTPKWIGKDFLGQG